MSSSATGGAVFGVIGAILLGVAGADKVSKNTRLILSVVGVIFLIIAFCLFAYAVHCIAKLSNKMMEKNGWMVDERTDMIVVAA